jgi:riboflavin kinase/FMN adenylyltransferase
METIEINIETLPQWQQQLPQNVIALGFFDGLHKGHQQVIEVAKRRAKKLGLPLSVMSFFPHPKSVLSGGKQSIDYLMPLHKKKEKLAELGVDYFFIVEFNMVFASLEPQDFITQYVKALNCQHIVCGYDYTYGKKGAGNVHTLFEDGEGTLGVTVVPKVDLHGEKVSSTRIRENLSDGKVKVIQQLLGEPYCIEWCVKQGLLPFYTLPAPGCYEVTVADSISSAKGIVYVSNQATIDFTHIQLPASKRFNIVWHNEALGQYKHSVIS